VDSKAGVAKESYRILKNGGRALVVDWSEAGTFGPSTDHVVTQDEARRIFENNNFAYERDLNAGSHHYGMVFRKT